MLEENSLWYLTFLNVLGAGHWWHLPCSFSLRMFVEPWKIARVFQELRLNSDYWIVKGLSSPHLLLSRMHSAVCAGVAWLALPGPGGTGTCCPEADVFAFMLLTMP